MSMKLLASTLLTLVGLTCLAYAVIMIWVPAAYMFGGVVLLRAAWIIDQKAPTCFATFSNELKNARFRFRTFGAVVST